MLAFIPNDGTEGQVLKSNGDGTAEWSDAGTPSQEQVGAAVDEWLNDHPEATTTVRDGSISRVKLNQDMQEKTDAVVDIQIWNLLQAETIFGTTQTMTFDSSGNILQIIHMGANNVAVRTDSFNFESNSITEIRTLSTGERMTIVTNTDTLVTTVTYIAS